jgi:uncharacterized iron-regulated membrane protein
MSLKSWIAKIHLWLVTGCIYAFQSEIQGLTQPYRYVEPRQVEVLPPSQIKEKADEALPGKHLHAVLYPTPDRAAQAIYYSYEDHYYYFVYVNQYTGEIQKVKDEFSDFFRIVLDGHFYLWLPPEVGQPVVASFTLVFLFMVISGIILWWPKKKKGIKKSFTIKWDGRWRRKNYDLHQVLGFYMMIFALVFALTGLVWGFTWFRDGIYAATTGGDKFVEYYAPLSDSTQRYRDKIPALDQVWMKIQMLTGSRFIPLTMSMVP